VAAREEIETEAGTVRIRENGIVHVVLARYVDVPIESARALHAARQELCQLPRAVLADIRQARSAQILAMRYTAGPEVAALTTRLALVIGSPVSRMIGNVFMGMWKPPYLTRMFTDQEAAVAWLLEGSEEAT
jgi:hypothetical protein